ncbi:hypothetical protein ACFGTC_000071 [Escherichia coli]|nr:hypothetical protein [Escherichia coli]EKH0083481.1 hypothetical protein [Escherichia coli]HAW7530393.1 hypothetical protein [Escherichia coli]
MTTITKERLLTIKQWRETYGPGSNVVLPAEEAEELARIALASLEAEPVSQTYKLPHLSSNEVNDAAWKLHNMLTEHGPLNGRQFNNLKGCFYEAFKVAMRNYPVTPDGWVMVPKQVTPEISNAINVVGQRCTCGNCSQRLWDLLLDATPQEVNHG